MPDLNLKPPKWMTDSVTVQKTPVISFLCCCYPCIFLLYLPNTQSLTLFTVSSGDVQTSLRTKNERL